MKPTSILILGAGGQIARHVVRALQNETAIRSTLFLRDSGKLRSLDTTGMTVVEGDVANETVLRKAIAGTHHTRARAKRGVVED